MASKEQAPQVFLRLSRYDVPWVGVLLSAGSGTLAYLTLGKVTSNSVIRHLAHQANPSDLRFLDRDGDNWGTNRLVCDLLYLFAFPSGLFGAKCCSAIHLPSPAISRLVGSQLVVVSQLVPFRFELMTAVFQGFIVFTRHNPYWSVVAKGWGFSLGPYFYPAVFLALIAFWMARTRYVTGSWSLEIKPLSQVDLVTGRAAEPLDSTNKSTWKTKLEGALKVL